ncbi:Rv2993c-like domain-containing protein, partial [uncultured Caldilinea sp.]|uniref:Rv2993c-like domain-containing protein n=1 Tax=uncultured Caldilinea sp. TaxID=435295 RepID=UPI00262DE66F
MRIVRYALLQSEEETALFSDAAQPEGFWGMLIDELIYPLHRAPYRDYDRAGVCRPALRGTCYRLDEVRLLAPVTPS